MIKERTELATPHLSGLLDFWLTKCTGDKPPVSSTIAPADLRPWKDNIVIFEVIGEDDFVYSYYGKALAEAFGHSRLGATLDELPEEQRAILRPEYESARRERLPVARVYTADFAGTTRTWERLVLPMSSDGELIDKILVAAYELTGERPGEVDAPCAPAAVVPAAVVDEEPSSPCAADAPSVEADADETWADEAKADADGAEVSEAETAAETGDESAEADTTPDDGSESEDTASEDSEFDEPESTEPFSTALKPGATA